jgi:hypothetical protein
MPVYDAINAFVLAYGLWLGMSALAFVLLGILVRTRKEAAATDARRESLQLFVTQKKADAERRPDRKAA